MKFYIKSKLSENISETPEGFLLCKNVMLTHTGALKYGPSEHPFGDEYGEVIMKREPEELFSDATLASFEGKDLTIQHPEEFVAPENYQELTNGVLVNIRKGSEEIEVEGEKCLPMLGDILVKSKEAIELVKSGMREVSLGYDALWQLISDTEGRHSKIIGNHCALVDEGRAGKYCAINDHKGENTMGLKEMNEKFKKLFGKTMDEAMSEKEEADKKAKDAEEAEKKKKEEESKDAEEEKKEEESKDEGSVEERLSKLESSISEILEALKAKSSDDKDESEEVVADDESEDEESEEDESEDEGEEESEEDKKDKKAGDAVLSKAEILAPGIKSSSDMKKRALTIAYKSEDGKKVIDTLTGGKKLSELSKDAEEAIFNAAAEMLKAKRVADFASQRVMTIDSFPALKNGTMTADEINKKNAEFYNKK